MLLVSFVAFFAMVLAWVAAPSAPMAETTPPADAVSGAVIAVESAA
ncbi:MAG: hypothetical protein U0031_19110 [Thermomicrobiales bacterium]